MQIVGNFLERFKNLKAPERSVRAAVISAVDDIVGVTIDDSCIKISGGTTLYLTPMSAIKSAIFENKLDIITRVNSILGAEQIQEIK